MNDLKKERLEKICRYLPENLSFFLLRADAELVSRLCEIRIRADKPVVLNFTDERRFITNSGRFTSFICSDLMSFSERETEDIFVSLCRCSVHSLEDNIADGFITVEGGSRVGIYGTAVTEGGRIRSVRNIRGLNIRISGEFRDTAVPIVNRIYNGECPNVLICGPPSSGKTTVMKDLCRILSDVKDMKVCLIDERGEARGSYTGINTDVLDGYPKAAGIEIAVRVLSPEVIAFDEIGTLAEAEAVGGGMNSGVSFIMTVHCKDETELIRKPQYIALRDRGAVDHCVFLGREGKTEKIISVKELEIENRSIDGGGDSLRVDRAVHSLCAGSPRRPFGKNTAYVFGDREPFEIPVDTFG